MDVAFCSSRKWIGSSYRIGAGLAVLMLAFATFAHAGTVGNSFAEPSPVDSSLTANSSPIFSPPPSGDSQWAEETSVPTIPLSEFKSQAVDSSNPPYTPSSLHLLAVGLVFLTIVHKLKLIPR